MKPKLLTVLFGVLALIVVVAAAPHHYLKNEFYVYDVSTKDFVRGAVVTITYDGGYQEAETRARNGEGGSVTFTIPGEVDQAFVTVDKDGYEFRELTVALSHRPHIGGQAFWIGLTPAQR